MLIDRMEICLWSPNSLYKKQIIQYAYNRHRVCVSCRKDLSSIALFTKKLLKANEHGRFYSSQSAVILTCNIDIIVQGGEGESPFIIIWEIWESHPQLCHRHKTHQNGKVTHWHQQSHIFREHTLAALEWYSPVCRLSPSCTKQCHMLIIKPHYKLTF